MLELESKSLGPYATAFYSWGMGQAEIWRVEGYVLYFANLKWRSDDFARTVKDWIGSYIDLPRALSSMHDFRKLWLDDLRPTDVPRDWLRSAVRFTQREWKVGSGNPGDEQHSAYLIDADLFLSADWRFIKVLEDVRRQAPFGFAEPRLVSTKPHGPVLDAIVDALT